MPNLTLLQLVQEFSDRQGLERPQIVMASLEGTVRQTRALLNEVIADITNRGTSWAKLQKEATFVTVAGEDQGLLATIAPFGFKYVIEGSFFDRTGKQPIYGPRNAAIWQQNKALVQTGPFASHRIWQDKLFLQPAVAAGLTIAFEYASDMAIKDPDGATWKKRFEKDEDVCELDEDLMLLGLRWKWRRVQGLSYAQEKDDFESMCSQIMGNEPTKGEVSLEGSNTGSLRPGVIVPSGNWNV